MGMNRYRNLRALAMTAARNADYTRYSIWLSHFDWCYCDYLSMIIRKVPYRETFRRISFFGGYPEGRGKSD